MAITKGPRNGKADKAEKAERKPRQKKEEEEVGEAVEVDKAGKGGQGGRGGAGKGEESEACVSCGRSVLSSQQGLKCDGCGFWHHADCEKVSEEIYNFLSCHNEESLAWYCRKCAVTYKKMASAMIMMNEQHQLLEDRLETVARLEKAHILLEEKVDKIMGRLDGSKMEEKVEELIHTVKEQSHEDTHRVHGCVGEAVRLQLQEDKFEVEEMEKRKSSVVIHGLKEPLATEPDDRKKEDGDYIAGLLHTLKCDDISVNGIVRLGARSDDVEKPRTIKLVLASEAQKEKLLKQAKNLRGSRDYGKVFIYQDLTPRQRERRRELVKELKERQSKGDKNLIIANWKIVVRRERRE